MQQVTTNLLPKSSMGTTNNQALDSSIRTKSANTIPRQRTGLLG